MSDDRRRDRKRKKREQRKNEQRNRGRSTQQPREQEQRPGTFDPAVAACLHDAAVPVAGQLVLAAWDALRTGRVVDTVPAPEMGQDMMCWHNVRRLVERRGGELVLGWSVVEVPLRDEIPPQRNRFARTALNAHAVWLFQGQYYETCPERVRMGTRFLPAGEASVMCDACIEFFDREEDAAAVDWPVMSFNMRPFAPIFVGLGSPDAGQPKASAPVSREAKPYPYTIFLRDCLNGRVGDADVAARVLEFARSLAPDSDRFIEEEVLLRPSAFPEHRRACVVRRGDAGGVPVEIMATRRTDGTIWFVVYDPASPVSPVNRVYLL